MVKFFTSFVFCEKFNFAKHFFEIYNEVILGDEIFSKNSKKPALDLLKGVEIENRITHQIFRIIRPSAM
jgi:hypothetical protein